jgi:hypothetical protein
LAASTIVAPPEKADSWSVAGFLLSGAVAVAAAALALAGKAAGTQPAAVPMSAFGGSVPVHIAHVGRIDVDLEPAGPQRLQRVTCSGLSGTGTACFVSR